MIEFLIQFSQWANDKNLNEEQVINKLINSIFIDDIRNKFQLERKYKDLNNYQSIIKWSIQKMSILPNYMQYKNKIINLKSYGKDLSPKLLIERFDQLMLKFNRSKAMTSLFFPSHLVDKHLSKKWLRKILWYSISSELRQKMIDHNMNNKNININNLNFFQLRNEILKMQYLYDKHIGLYSNDPNVINFHKKQYDNYNSDDSMDKKYNNSNKKKKRNNKEINKNKIKKSLNNKSDIIYKKIKEESNKISDNFNEFISGQQSLIKQLNNIKNISHKKDTFAANKLLLNKRASKYFKQYHNSSNKVCYLCGDDHHRKNCNWYINETSNNFNKKLLMLFQEDNDPNDIMNDDTDGINIELINDINIDNNTNNDSSFSNDSYCDINKTFLNFNEPKNINLIDCESENEITLFKFDDYLKIDDIPNNNELNEPTTMINKSLSKKLKEEGTSKEVTTSHIPKEKEDDKKPCLPSKSKSIKKKSDKQRLDKKISKTPNTKNSDTVKHSKKQSRHSTKIYSISKILQNQTLYKLYKDQLLDNDLQQEYDELKNNKTFPTSLNNRIVNLHYKEIGNENISSFLDDGSDNNLISNKYYNNVLKGKNIPILYEKNTIMVTNAGPEKTALNQYIYLSVLNPITLQYIRAKFYIHPHRLPFKFLIGYKLCMNLGYPTAQLSKNGNFIKIMKENNNHDVLTDNMEEVLNHPILQQAQFRPNNNDLKKSFLNISNLVKDHNNLINNYKNNNELNQLDMDKILDNDKNISHLISKYNDIIINKSKKIDKKKIKKRLKKNLNNKEMNKEIKKLKDNIAENISNKRQTKKQEKQHFCYYTIQQNNIINNDDEDCISDNDNLNLNNYSYFTYNKHTGAKHIQNIIVPIPNNYIYSTHKEKIQYYQIQIENLTARDDIQALDKKNFPFTKDDTAKGFEEINIIINDVRIRKGNYIANKLELLFYEYFQVIAKHKFDIGKIPNIQYEQIIFADTKPRRIRPYKTNRKYEDEMKHQCKLLLDADQIEESDSPWASSALIVVNGDGTLRMCVDYSWINKHSIQELFPTEDVKRVLRNFDGAKIFSVLDINKAFWNIAVHENTKDILAFVTPFGQYTWKVMPFGACNAPGVWNKACQHIFHGIDDLNIYVDDFAVASKDVEKHFRALRTIFDKCVKYSLRLKISKCKWFEDHIKFVGHDISKNGRKPTPQYLGKIFQLKKPTTTKEFQHYFSTINYLNEYIPGLLHAFNPLLHLLNNKNKFHWKPEYDEHFFHVQSLVNKAHILSHPNFDKPFIIHVDSSDHSYGAVLTQLNDNGVEVPIEFCSRKWTDGQIGWHITDKELLALIKVIDKWQYYLYNKFTVYTDARNIVSLYEHYDKPKPSARHYRWCLNLSQYINNMNIEHIPGDKNIMADYLSRFIDHDAIHKLQKQYNIKHNISFFINHKITKYQQLKIDPKTLYDNPFEIESNMNQINNTFITNEQQSLMDNTLKAINKDDFSHAHELIKNFITLRNGKKYEFDRNIVINLKNNKNKKPSKIDLIEIHKKHKSINSDSKNDTIPIVDNSNDNKQQTHHNINNINLKLKNTIDNIHNKYDDDILHDEKIEIDAELSLNKNILNTFEKFEYNDPINIIELPDKAVIDKSMFNKRNLLNDQKHHDTIIQLIRKWLLSTVKDKNYYWLHGNIIHDIKYNKYKIHTNELLYHYNDNINQWVLVIPKRYRYKYLKYIHDSKYMAMHGSKDKMAFHAKNYIYWPGIDEDINNYINHCKICQLRGRQTNKNAGLLQPIDITEPWTTLQLDIAGPLHRTFNGNEFFVLIRDMCTGLVEAAGIPDIRSITICKFIYDYWISRYGMFKNLLSDNGTQLTSKVTHTFCKQFNIKQKFTTPYHPQCDGGSERMVQEIKKHIKILLYEHKQKANRWDEYLRMILAKMNNTPQRSSKLTPNQLVYGRIINHLLSYKLDIDDINNKNKHKKIEKEINWYQMMQHLQNRLKKLNDIRNSNKTLYNKKMKQYYDKKHKHVSYNINDKVWYYVGDKIVNKNAFMDKPKWTGPFFVTKTWNDGKNYTIKIPYTDISLNTHISKLKLFKFNRSINNEIYKDLSNEPISNTIKLLFPEETNSDFSDITNCDIDYDSIVSDKDNDSDYDLNDDLFSNIDDD